MRILALAGLMGVIPAAVVADPIIIRGGTQATVTESALSTNNLASSTTNSVTNSIPIVLGTNATPSGSLGMTNRPDLTWKQLPAVTNMPSITNAPSHHIEPRY
jgi:hypothetical protein